MSAIEASILPCLHTLSCFCPYNERHWSAPHQLLASSAADHSCLRRAAYLPIGPHSVPVRLPAGAARGSADPPTAPLRTPSPIVGDLLGHDQFLTMADYRSYVDRQDDVDRSYANLDTWTRSSILNTARCGFFSSDRAIRQYCEDIWGVSPIPVPLTERE